MKTDMTLFEDYKIRRVYDEEAEIWWFSVIDIVQAADGKNYLTDVATAETLLRLVQSVPNPKAEPIKLWLAKVGYERMQEMADPSRSLNCARETWQVLHDHSEIAYSLRGNG